MGGTPTDYGAGNYSSGYGSYSPGQTSSGADPSHPEYSYFQSGWEAAQSEYNTQSAMDSMFHGFFGEEEAHNAHTAHGAEEYDPTEDYLTNEQTSFADLQKYLSTEANPNAVAETLTEYNGLMYGWNTETNSWDQKDTPGQYLLNEETGEWESYTAPAGGYGWSDGRWSASGSDLSGYSSIYTSEGDYYERATFDDMMSGRMDAAGAATDYVNSQISDEQSNANLLGVDYTINDEQKSSRINDYFASIWSESDETTISELADVWGESLDRAGVMRGDAGNVSEESGTTTLKTSAGMKPSTLATTEDENTLGGKNTLLGGA